MSASEYINCKVCGAKYPKGQRCFCFYEKMDMKTIKPVPSTNRKPFDFFETFLSNGNPYCFLFKFYLSEGRFGQINENDQVVYRIRQIPGTGQFIDPMSMTYVKYLENIFKLEVNRSLYLCDEYVYASSPTKRKQNILLSDLIIECSKIVRYENRGVYSFSSTNLLGESIEIRELFKSTIKLLISELEMRKNANSNRQFKGGVVYLKDIIKSDESYKEIERELELMCIFDYFEKKVEGFNYILGRYTVLAAIVERWKRDNHLKETYCHGKAQRQLCRIICESFNLDLENFDTVYKHFKPGQLYNRELGNPRQLKDEVLRRMDDIDFALQDAAEKNPHL